MITVYGEAYGRTYDYECELISRTDKEAIFATRTEPKHEIRITPRYVGSIIGSADFNDRDGKPTTVCAFLFDGEYVALALFKEDADGNIEITPHEY